MQLAVWNKMTAVQNRMKIFEHRESGLVTG